MDKMPTYLPYKQIVNWKSSSLLSNFSYKKIYLNKVFATNIESGLFLTEFPKITKNNSRGLVPNLAAGRLRIAHSILLNPNFYTIRHLKCRFYN